MKKCGVQLTIFQKLFNQSQQALFVYFLFLKVVIMISLTNRNQSWSFISSSLFLTKKYDRLKNPRKNNPTINAKQWKNVCNGDLSFVEKYPYQSVFITKVSHHFGLTFYCKRRYPPIFYPKGPPDHIWIWGTLKMVQIILGGQNDFLSRNTFLHMFMQVLFLVGNHGNHKDATILCWQFF